MTRELKIACLNMSLNEKKFLYTFLKRQNVEFDSGWFYRKDAIEAIELHLKNSTKISEKRRESLKAVVVFFKTGKDTRHKPKAKGQKAKEWIDKYFKEKGRNV